MSKQKNSSKSLQEMLHRDQKNYNHTMFEFLKKPNHHDSHHMTDREIPIESSDEPHGEDIGQIAVDVLETHE